MSDIEISVGTKAVISGPDEVTLNATVLSVVWREKKANLRTRATATLIIKPGDDPALKLADAFRSLSDTIRNTIE